MENYLETLSITEADKLKKTIAALFRQTCILQEKYDPVTLVPRDNEQYEICARQDRKSTRLNSSHNNQSRMPSSA